MTFNASNGNDYPYALRHNLIDQMKILKKKFPNFESFKDADISKIFNKDEILVKNLTEGSQLIYPISKLDSILLGLKRD